MKQSISIVFWGFMCLFMGLMIVSSYSSGRDQKDFLKWRKSEDKRHYSG